MFVWERKKYAKLQTNRIWRLAIVCHTDAFCITVDKWFKRLFSGAIAFIILYMINNIAFTTAQQHQQKIPGNILWPADTINLIDVL